MKDQPRYFYNYEKSKSKQKGKIGTIIGKDGKIMKKFIEIISNHY